MRRGGDRSSAPPHDASREDSQCDTPPPCARVRPDAFRQRRRLLQERSGLLVVRFRDRHRRADCCAHDDGDGVGLSQKPADRHHAGRLEAVQRNPGRIPNLHEHASGSPAVHAEQGLVQQLPSERRTTRAFAAACRRGRDVSGIQPPLGPSLHARRSYRRLLPAKRECHGHDRDCGRPRFPRRGSGNGAFDDLEGSAGPFRLHHLAGARDRGWEESPRGAARTSSPRSNMLPIEQLEPAHGEAIFAERCTSCHGVDGQGVAVGDKKPGPLWGPDSWNDGAGAARVYTLAGIIRYSMPYLDPGSLTDEEAQQLAAFIILQAAPLVSIQVAGLPHREAAGRQRVLPQAHSLIAMERHPTSVEPSRLMNIASLRRLVAFTAILGAFAADVHGQLRTTVYASGFRNPVAFVQDPMDPRVQFVVQQSGRIRTVRSGTPPAG